MARDQGGLIVYASRSIALLVVLATLWVAPACTAIEAPATREVIHLKGTPFERGRQHGEQLHSKIRSFYTTILATSLMPYINRERPDIALYLTEYQQEKYKKEGEFARLLMLQSALEMEKSIAPEHIEEMKGVAAGAGLEYEQILILNTFLDTVLATRAIAYVLRLGQAPRLKRLEFVGGLDSDGFDNDGDGTIDNKNEGRITKYEPGAWAVMADVPVDAEIRWRLHDPDHVDPATVRVQLDKQIFEFGDPALTTVALKANGTPQEVDPAAPLPAAATLLEVRFKPPAPMPAAATMALIIQAGDTSKVIDPPPLHARFMRDERLVFTTAGMGVPPQQVSNRSVDDGRSQPPASALAVRGSATPDNNPLLGQHFSLLDANSSHKHGVVFVHHPTDGDPFAVVGWAGLIYGMSGMNAGGLATAAVYSDTLDNRLVGTLLGQVVAAGGDLSAGRLTASGLPIGFAVRHILENSSDVVAAEAEIAKLSHVLGWNYLLADGKSGMRAVEVDAGAVSFPPPATPSPQTFSYGPGDVDALGRRMSSVGPDDMQVGAHYRLNTKDVMTLPVTETIRIDPQRFWSSYYYKSLRVSNLVADQVAADYGKLGLTRVQTLLGHEAVVDTSDSMNAVVYEPATGLVHAAMGAVPATSMPFETVDLNKGAP